MHITYFLAYDKFIHYPYYIVNWFCCADWTNEDSCAGGRVMSNYFHSIGIWDCDFFLSKGLVINQNFPFLRRLASALTNNCIYRTLFGILKICKTSLTCFPIAAKEMDRVRIPQSFLTDFFTWNLLSRKNKISALEDV